MNWRRPITDETAKVAAEYLKKRTVLWGRQEALELIRNAFQSNPVGRWVSDNPEVQNEIFPRFLEVGIETFLNTFTVDEENFEPIGSKRQEGLEFPASP